MEKANPAKSAKDAINAMYSGSQKKPLSAYLADSKPKPGRAAAERSKSAASLHHSNSQRITYTRPSASTLLKRADGEKRPAAPVMVSTSLKLKSSAMKPKEPEISRPARGNAKLDAAIGAIKSAATVAVPPKKAATRPAAAKKPVAPIKKPAAPKVTPSARPRMSTMRSGRVMQDIVRPAKQNIALKQDITLKPAPEPAPRVEPEIPKIPEPKAPKETKERLSPAPAPKTRPLDSVKNRFRPAPKDFAANSAKEARPASPYKVEDFLNPTHSSEDLDYQTDFNPNPQPVAESPNTRHIYGMTEGPEEFSGIPSWAKAAAEEPRLGAAGALAHLGVVEDYRPSTASSTPANAPAESASALFDATVRCDGRIAPSRDHDALGAKSPYFLESIKVDKRPLSDSVTPQEVKTSVYGAQELTDKPAKNRYEKPEKKSKKSKKDDSAPTIARSEIAFDRRDRDTLTDAPTVIIPSHSQSRAPVWILLIITVILGAVVGALIYLFLFQ